MTDPRPLSAYVPLERGCVDSIGRFVEDHRGAYTPWAEAQATLDATRARHAALVEAADAVCQAWIADEAGEETFDPNLIDALGDALYGTPEEARNG